MQKSVFTGEMEEDTLTELITQAKEIINLETDSLVVLRLCSDCWDKAEEYGQHAIPDENYCFAIF
ncbi:hypothetical protein OfM1_11370 [Lactovum odontotermitis]